MAAKQKGFNRPTIVCKKNSVNNSRKEKAHLVKNLKDLSVSPSNISVIKSIIKSLTPEANYKVSAQVPSKTKATKQQNKILITYKDAPKQGSSSLIKTDVDNENITSKKDNQRKKTQF